MLSNPVEMEVIWDKETDKEKQLVDMVKRILDDNKMDYKNKEILRRKLSELEVAVIWYYDETGEAKPKYTLKCKIVSPSLGDTLYPLFDTVGTMIAFRRDYGLTENGKIIEHSDIYTKEFEYKYVKKDSVWSLDGNPIPNIAQKILIEYYCQKKPVWYKVQPMISRLETITSNHGGMNDKFGAPMFIISGEIQGEIIDNQTGSVMQMENGGAANYAQLASEPESISLEQKNLEKFIYTMSQTPNISFDQMITIGAMSGFAAEMLLTDPHMAVRTEEETFGIGLQRRYNIIKAAIGALIDTSLAAESKTVQLKPVITPYIPQNASENIDMLAAARIAGIMSTETAVEKNYLIDDKDMEMQRINDEESRQPQL